MKITSLSNDKVIYWAKLKMKKYRDIEHVFIVEGENLVNEALKKGIVKEIICLDEEKYDIPTFVVTEEILKRISSLINPPKIMAVCSYILPSDIEGNVLVLDKIQDPGNLGTIIRSAVAFDFKTIICSTDTVDLYNDKVIRSSEGMIFNINILKDNLDSAIPFLKNKGYFVISTDVNSGKSIKLFKNHDKKAIVIGNEGNGVSMEVKELCDDFCFINMNKTCESLNASVASSILMYEVFNEK